MANYLLKNGMIIDGSGREGYQADVLIEDGRIAQIGEIRPGNETVIYDCTGLYVTPGFIDCHSHSDMVVLEEFSAFNVLEQGITTEITGHCGTSILPFLDGDAWCGDVQMPPEHKSNILRKGAGAKAVMKEIEAIELPTNIALFIGHGNVRIKVMGYAPEDPSPEQLEQMKSLIRDGMDQGAFGLSAGLFYPPGSNANEEELISLCKVVSEYKGYYTTHIRNESRLVTKSVLEALKTGKNADVPVVISHHKVEGKENKGKSAETLRLIDIAVAGGQIVGMDQYPYDGSSTGLVSALPPGYATNGMSGVLKHLQNAETRREIAQELKTDSDAFENLIHGCGSFDAILVQCGFTRQYNGMSLQQVADDMKKDPYDAMFDLILENQGEVGAIFIDVNDWDIENIMKHPLTMAGVDGAQMKLRGEMAHPRCIGTFPKIIGMYCRDKKLMPLESCIRKLTGLPAEFYGLDNKGLIREGRDADLVVFDYHSIAGNADYSHSTAANTGIRYVFVNGEPAVKDGTITGIKNGRLLRRGG